MLCDYVDALKGLMFPVGSVLVCWDLIKLMD